MGRVTLQGALRLDIASSIFPEAEIGGVRFLPTVTTFPETKGVDAYKDLTPRGGVAYDVFGNGKTAVKVSFGRYLEAAQNGGLFVASRPTSRVSTTATRTWTDSNGNFTPDCDLLNNAAQNLIASGGDFCGAVANTNFGKSVVRHDAGSGAVLRLGRARGRLAVRRLDPAAAAGEGVGRGRLLPPLAEELHRHRQPDGGREQPTTRSRSRRRSIRGCPTAADMPIPGRSTTSTRPWRRRRPATSSRWRATTANRRRSRTRSR